MLTLKWVTPQGFTYTYSVNHVETSPYKGRQRPQIDDEILPHELVKMVTYERSSDGMVCSLDTGTVYVMNHMGKTVDRYDLEKYDANGGRIGTADGYQGGLTIDPKDPMFGGPLRNDSDLETKTIS